MGPERFPVPGPPRYATRGNLSAVAGVVARKQGEYLANTRAYDRFALMKG